MNIVYQTPLLEGEASTGKSKFWQAQVATDGMGNFYTSTISYSRLNNGSESSHIESAPKLIKVKNEGRSNERSGLDQAIAEVDSAAQLKKDRGYFLEGEISTKTHPSAMLAHKYKDRAHNMNWPAYIQPKLDGTRLLFDGKTGWSREGREYIPEVLEHLRVELPDGVILDGELMLDQNRFTFQETIRAIKKYRADTTPELCYHVYDLVSPKTFTERYAQLSNIVGALNHPNIRLVETHVVNSPLLVDKWHDEFVAQGYEGAMLRNGAASYKDGHRSADLLKIKKFEDAEFEIIGVIDGEAKATGCAIFVCVTPNGETFTCVPKGTYESRRETYANRDEYIGKMLTVKYQGFSETHIPRFPVGLAVRDYE